MVPKLLRNEGTPTNQVGRRGRLLFKHFLLLIMGTMIRHGRIKLCPYNKCIKIYLKETVIS